MIRKLSVVFLGVVLLVGIAAAGTEEFYKGSFTLTPLIGLNKYTVPFGLNAEIGITPNIGIGGTAMVWLWSDTYSNESIIALSVEALYHFTQLQARDFDLFAGLGLGYAIYSYSAKGGGMSSSGSGSSGLDLAVVFGGRYFFSPKLAVCLRLVGSLLGDWSGFGAELGLTIRMK